MRYINDKKQLVGLDRDPSAKPCLQVIAAGLPRTATTSLQSAFDNHLNLGPCQHMAEVMPEPSRLKLGYYALYEKDKNKRQAMLHQLFDGYVSTSDYPGCAFAADLMDMYPDAKVILNQRESPEAWQKSFKGSMSYFSSNWYYVLCYWTASTYWHSWSTTAYTENVKRLGVADVWSKEFYIKHNDWVRREAKKRGRDILEFRPEDGWAPLCKFLGKEKSEVDFPRLNDAAVLRTLKIILTVRGLAIWVGLMGGPVMAWWVLMWMRS